MYSDLLSSNLVWPLAILLIVLIWLTVLSFFFFRYIRHYNRLAEGADVSNLSRALNQHFEEIAEAQSNIQKIKEAISKLEKDGCGHLQRTGVVRFNPFSDTGGDQSFAVSLLDAKGNGVVISSLHSREVTRMYSKPVKGGKEAGFEFSKEEREAIEKALKGG